MVLTGYTHQVAGPLTPALVITPEHAASGDPALLAAHCLEQVDPGLAEAVDEGDFLVVAGELSGGAGAAAAVTALQAQGFAATICVAADDDVVAAATAAGLALLVAPEAVTAIDSGRVLRLDLARGAIEDIMSRERWPASPCPPAMLAAVQRTQLLFRMRRVAEDEGYAE